MSLDKTKTKETLPTPEGLGLSETILVELVLEAVIRQLNTACAELREARYPLPLTCRVSLAQTLLKEALEALEALKDE